MDREKFCEVSWESALVSGKGSYINPDTSKVLILGFDCSWNHTPSTTPYKVSKLMLSLTIWPDTKSVRFVNLFSTPIHLHKKDYLILIFFIFFRLCKGGLSTITNHFWLDKQVEASLNEFNLMKGEALVTTLLWLLRMVMTWNQKLCNP